jgi:4'-phosphopantetheinyl transferase
VVFLFSSSACGIDIEKIKPGFDFEGMMASVFHPREIDWINGQLDRNRAFFKLWTIKESLIKAQGTGLVDDLNQWDLTENPGFSEADWYINTFAMGEEYFLSACVADQSKGFKFFELSGKIYIPS